MFVSLSLTQDLLIVLFSRSYAALIGVVTHDYFDDLSDADARRGVAAERRDRMLQGCNSHMTSTKS